MKTFGFVPMIEMEASPLMKIVRIDANRITDGESFHHVFAETFGFPDFYGRNMDAWIDCLSDLDEPSTAMTTVHIPSGEVLVLHLDNAQDFARRCPDLYTDLVECAAFVNYRRIEAGQSAVLALSFFVA